MKPLILALLLTGCATAPQLDLIEPVPTGQQCQDAAADHITLLRAAGVADSRIGLLLVTPEGMQAQKPFAFVYGAHVAVVVDGVAVFDNGSLAYCHQSFNYATHRPGDIYQRSFHVSGGNRCLLDEAVHGIPNSEWEIKPLTAALALGGILLMETEK